MEPSSPTSSKKSNGCASASFAAASAVSETSTGLTSFSDGFRIGSLVDLLMDFDFAGRQQLMELLQNRFGALLVYLIKCLLRARVNHPACEPGACDHSSESEAEFGAEAHKKLLEPSCFKSEKRSVAFQTDQVGSIWPA